MKGSRSFTLQGTKEDVNKVKDMLQDIINELEQGKITIEKPGMPKIPRIRVRKSDSYWNRDSIQLFHKSGH